MTRRLLLLTALLSLSYAGGSARQIGDWIRSKFGDSKVNNARTVPAPVVPAKDPHLRYIQFLAVGDFGTGGPEQKDVAASMAKKAEAEPVTFIVSTGDNICESGVSSVTDPQWKEKFEDVYFQQSLQVPFYAVLGNHDYHSSTQAQIEYSRISTRWKMPDYYYSFSVPMSDTASIQFFCLDTNPLSSLDTAEVHALPDSGKQMRQVRWLERELSASHARWKVVVGHHTIYSGGSHGDNDGLRVLLEPVMAHYGVDVYLCGHDHHLELIAPVHGITYVISGAGGKRRDVTWRDNTLFAATNYGFNFFRVSAKNMLIEFLDRGGNIRYVHEITK